MYQIEMNSNQGSHEGRSVPTMGFLPGILCWPGLLIQWSMHGLGKVGGNRAQWQDETLRQSTSIAFTWLYSGVFWFFLSGCVTLATV